MKRIAIRFVAPVACVLVLVATGALVVRPWNDAGAQENRSITIDVKFRPTSDDLAPGDVCGYLDIDTPIWPHSKQVIVTDAAGVIVGTVDLLDVFNPVVFPAPDEAQPGIVDDDDLCVVTRSVEVTDSAYYTFAIDGSYRWTVSREDLAERDWLMPIEFYE